MQYLLGHQHHAEELRRWNTPPPRPAPEPIVEPALHAELTRAAQAEVDAAIASLPKPKPWELRARYPRGWMNAPYVRCPKLTALKEKQDAER